MTMAMFYTTIKISTYTHKKYEVEKKTRYYFLPSAMRPPPLRASSASFYGP
jgi:hypothetical protein